MLRYRRYRVCTVFAVLTVLTLWHFTGSETWRFGGLDRTSSSSPATNDVPNALAPPPDSHGEPVATEHEHQVPDITVPQANVPMDKQELPVMPEPIKPMQGKPPPAIGVSIAAVDENANPYIDDNNVMVNMPDDEPQVVVPHEGGEGRKEIENEEKAIHWRELTAHFPVASTIQLPAGSPKPAPKVQASFADETPAEARERKAKLAAIKEAVAFSWNGYRQYAWMQDELSPVSNGSRNPFAGWGATLVDALDTLYIVGLRDEFNEAVAAVADIDFTTTFRKDIPLFETVIRYLGGLIGAYDISGLKHKILLDKAVELADILMGAFDTPNRMPITFYYWMPTYASQPHRAGTRVVLAEIGSLSVEFTRLAQLTKEPKYYDAIARITNAFKQWDSTLLPGMWPIYVDASGCKRPPQSDLADHDISVHTPPGSAEKPLPANNPERFGGKNPVPDDDHDEISDHIVKRQLDHSLSLAKAVVVDADDEARTEGATTSSSKSAEGTSTKQAKPGASLAQCDPQGLAPSSARDSQLFTLGGMSDSLYEYLSKEYLLLGGLAPEYRELYERAADVAKANLLYRPMLPHTDTDILFAGTLSVSPPDKDNEVARNLKHEGTHLTCFAGGMFAYGAKIFGRAEDVKIGAELTEGCVWAYNVTKTGIMPEAILLTACDSLAGCEWNETRWHEELDPHSQSRQQTYEHQLEQYSSQVALARSMATATAAEESESNVAAAEAIPTNAIPDVGSSHRWDRRQPGGTSGKTTHSSAHELADSAVDHDDDLNDAIISQILKPQKPLGHEEFVKKRIEEERLPMGFTKVEKEHYILRPEAIESVWYMYRITGDVRWREAGWHMFQAVQAHCRTKFGFSAIDDVTKAAPELIDESESFWLAETLKYFWLLFADESVVSLDEWVLNTEAHPFRRPDAGPWPPKKG